MARSRMIGMGTPSIHSRIPRPIECAFLKLVADSRFSISLRLLQVHLRRALAALRIELASSVANLPSVRYHTVGKHQKQRGGEWIRKLRIDKARSAWRCRRVLVHLRITVPTRSLKHLGSLLSAPGNGLK